MSQISEKDTLKKNVLMSKIITFCEHCTLHGVFYFTSTRWLVVITWALILAASMVLCAFLSNMIWTKFNLDPTVTVVETTHYSTSKIPFPAVIVCETDHVYGPNTKNLTNLLLLRGFNSLEIGSFYKSFGEIKEVGYVPAPAVVKMHALLEDLDYSYKTTLEMITKPCEMMINMCIWRSRKIDCSTMFRQIYAPIGFCCRFDTRYFEKHGGSENNYTTGIEITESFVMFVNGKKISHDGKTKDGYLFLFVIDQDNHLTYIDNPVTLTPAAFFDVSINLWAIDSSSPVKALSVASRKCFLPSDRQSASFYEGCITSLIIRKAVLNCHCLPFDFTAKDLGIKNYSPCTWSMYMCIYNTLEQIKGQIHNTNAGEKCYQKCDFVQYDFSLEQVFQRRNSSELQDGISKVAFHFVQNTCMKYRREVLYTWDQMLANLGGIFGLCLGGSIISILELIWFLIDISCSILFFKPAKKVTFKKVDPWMVETPKGVYPYRH